MCQRGFFTLSNVIDQTEILKLHAVLLLLLLSRLLNVTGNFQINWNKVIENKIIVREKKKNLKITRTKKKEKKSSPH